MSEVPKRPDHSTRQFVVALIIVLAAVTAGTLFTMRFQGPRPANKPTALGHVVSSSRPLAANMVLIPAGSFRMGSDEGADDERPAHTIQLKGFWMDRTEVTNDQFEEFVRATGYVTAAEKTPNLGLNLRQLGTNTAPGSFVLARSATNAISAVLNLEWRFIPGTNWRQPDGPGSTLYGRGKHPVVHVSWVDAVAYANWAHKRLPTEAEWEYAAWAKPGSKTLAFGNDAPTHVTNTVPVTSSRSNHSGLFGMVENVSEWCSDWYHPDFYVNSPTENPLGPDHSVDPIEPAVAKKVIRGASFLNNTPAQIRITTRMRRSPYLSYSDVGFRCVQSVK